MNQTQPSLIGDGFLCIGIILLQPGELRMRRGNLLPYDVHRGAHFRYCPVFGYVPEYNGTDFRYFELSGVKMTIDDGIAERFSVNLPSTPGIGSIRYAGSAIVWIRTVFR